MTGDSGVQGCRALGRNIVSGMRVSRFLFLALICFWVCGGVVFSEIGGLPPMPSIRGTGADRSGALSDAISKAVAFYSGFYPVAGSLPMSEVKPSSFRVLREDEKGGSFRIEIQPLFSSKPRFQSVGVK